MTARRWLVPLVVATGLGACGTKSSKKDVAPDSRDSAPAVTYYGHAKSVLDAKCATCHRAGEIAPFDMTTFAGASQVKAAIAAAVTSGKMPPWQADASCNKYHNDGSLNDQDKQTLLNWVAQDAPEGDLASFKAVTAVEQAAPVYDTTLTMAEAYTPKIIPDDYRCFLLRWPQTESRFITGFKFVPGQRQMAHHMLAYAVPKSTEDFFTAMDKADPGPGYTCFGGPTNSRDRRIRVTQVAGWAPGKDGESTPPGVGLKVEPGALIIVQMHYNILTGEPVPDQSTIKFQTTAQVERPGASFLFTNFGWLEKNGMPIKAGAERVEKETNENLSKYMGILGADTGVASGEPFLLHRVGLHMHQLGEETSMTLVRKDGGTQCLLHIPKWDFNWQGSFRLAQPVLVQPGDQIKLKCRWDNSAANQRVVNGVRGEPRDVEWGEGTGDEMCLMSLLVTRP